MPNPLPREADSNNRALRHRQTLDKLDRTIAYMKQQYRSAITREQLAELAGLHPDHYSRIFRKYKGVSPMDYLAQLRIEQAKTLLRLTELPVVEVGQRVGYADPYHFSRRFKQLTGISPAGYVRQQPSRVVALDGLGHCLALGVSPCAADHTAVGGFVAPLADLPPDIGSALCPRTDLERLMALQPTLVLTGSAVIEQELADSLPALRLDAYQDPIYEQLPAVAARLDRREQAAAWIAGYEARRAELRAKVHSVTSGSRVAILRIRGELMQMYGMLNMGYALYRSLQLPPPERIAVQSLCNEHFHSSVITIEELPFYAAEHLFVVVQPDAAAAACWQALTASRPWRDYPAVQAGHVYKVDVADWLSNDPLSLLGQMEEAATLLAAEAHHIYPSREQ